LPFFGNLSLLSKEKKQNKKMKSSKDFLILKVRKNFLTIIFLPFDF